MALITFSGLASGIDSSALIEALLDQERTAKVTPLQNKIAEYQDTNSAFEELSTLLTTLQSATAKFRVINGGALAKQATSSDESVVTASAGNSAQAGTYALNVTQLASNATFSFDDRFSSETDVINSSINDGAAEANRTVSFTVGSGADQEDVDVVLTSSSTASDFVSSFNSQSDKASASLVNVGTDSSPSYAIMINSNSEGEEDGQILLDSVGSEIGPAFSAYALDQAKNAEFTIDGISGTISRSSNTISDIVSGVTFNLESTGSATVSVTSDIGATQETVQEFVDAYNEVVNFIAENDTITRDDSSEEGLNIFGPLAASSLDDNLLAALRSDISSASASGGTVNILADMGITTERDGTLKFDTDTFEEAMSSDPASVGTILKNLGESFSAVDGTIAQFTQFNGLFDQAINANDTQISTMQDRIALVEDNLKSQEEALVARFARLESLVGQMNSQQNSLASILPT